MVLNLVDRSNYFKGLLIMIGKDRIISKNEVGFIKKLGNLFDYDSGFVMECVNDLLSNKYLDEAPFLFQSREITVAFIKDAIKLLYCDGIVDSREYNWLLLISHKNGLDEGFCTGILEEVKKNFDKDHFADDLEVEKFLK